MKKYILSILILAIMVIVYSCKEDDDNDDKMTNVLLSGIITDSQDLPVPLAEIEFYEEVQSNSKAQPGFLSDKFIGSDTTDEDGNFSISIPEIDNVYAVIQHEDFQNKKYKIKDLQKSGTKTFLKGDRKEECQSTLTLQVSGTYTNEENSEIVENPLDKAKVLVYRGDKLIRKSHTNDKGNFTFNEMCPGDYSIQAFFEGQSSEKVEVKIDEEKNYYSTLYMQLKQDEKDTCCDGIMKFYPKDKDGNIIEGAKVILYKSDKAIEDPVVKDGKAVIDGVCEGKYKIVIKKEGYEALTFEVEIGCNKTIEIEKTMTKKEEECCDATLDIYLQNKNNEKVNGTVILKKEGKENKSKKSENGKARFEELCEGKYTIVIESEDYQRMEFTYEVKCHDSLTIAKTLTPNEKDTCCDGIMKFYPKDKDGNIIEGAKVILYKSDKAIEDPVVKDGKAVIDGVCEGKYKIVIKKEGYEALTFEVEIGCNKTIEIEKTMTKKEEECCDATLDIYLQNKNNEKVNGTVILKKEGKENKSKKSENGKARFEELCEGKYTIVIESEDYQRMEFTYEVKCHDSLTITKTLTPNEKDTCCDATIKIYAKDEQGKYIDSADVEYWLGGIKVAEGKTNVDGHFVAEDLCKGKYTIVIKKDGYKSLETTWEIKECKVYQETFKLKK